MDTEIKPKRERKERSPYTARPLSVKAEKFAEAFGRAGSPTYGNAQKSAIQAGYGKSSGRGVAPKLLRDQRVKDLLAKIAEQDAHNLRAQTDISIATVRAYHLALYDESRTKGDLATATRNIEDLGKMVGAYQDGAIINLDLRREMSERERSELLKISEVVCMSVDTKARPALCGSKVVVAPGLSIPPARTNGNPGFGTCQEDSGEDSSDSAQVLDGQVVSVEQNPPTIAQDERGAATRPDGQGESSAQALGHPGASPESAIGVQPPNSGLTSPGTLTDEDVQRVLHPVVPAPEPAPAPPPPPDPATRYARAHATRRAARAAREERIIAATAAALPPSPPNPPAALCESSTPGTL